MIGGQMVTLKEFKVRLIGDVVQTVSILAETHTIAIYRAAACRNG